MLDSGVKGPEKHLHHGQIMIMRLSNIFGVALQSPAYHPVLRVPRACTGCS